MIDEELPEQTPGGADRALPFVESGMDSELYQHHQPPVSYVMDQNDEMPRMMPTPWENQLCKPLHPSSLVCMADRSAFVLRDGLGQIVALFRPDETTQLSDGRRVARRSDVLRRARSSKVGRSLRVLAALVSSGPLVELEPIRRACDHYVRQRINAPDGDQKLILRMCTAQRSDAGEFISLRDNAQVYDCELRSPRLSTHEVDAFDDSLIALGIEAEKKRVEDAADRFDVDEELNLTNTIFSK